MFPHFFDQHFSVDPKMYVQKFYILFVFSMVNIICLSCLTTILILRGRFCRRVRVGDAGQGRQQPRPAEHDPVQRLLGDSHRGGVIGAGHEVSVDIPD